MEVLNIISNSISLNHRVISKEFEIANNTRKTN